MRVTFLTNEDKTVLEQNISDAINNYETVSLLQTWSGGYWNAGNAITNKYYIKTTYSTRKEYVAGTIFEVPKGVKMIVSTFSGSGNATALVDTTYADGGSHELTEDIYVSISLAYVPNVSIADDNRDALIASLSVKCHTGYKFVSYDKYNEDKESTNYIATKLNNSINELRALKNSVDQTMAALAQVRSGAEQIMKTFTVSSVGEHDRYLLRIGMHYGSAAYTPNENDVFFDGSCNTDFSDVRFFDANGKLLMAELSEPVHLDFYADPNVDGVIKTTGSGYMLKYKNGIYISKDNASTWALISGTNAVTENSSDEYGRTSMYPIYVDGDDNIFAYAGGIIYKLLASDDYATKKEVCDFSWVNGDGETVYPDILDHAMDGDSDGNIFFGNYTGGAYHTDLWTSHDYGETWTKTLTSTEEEYQHVHHVQADLHTGTFYVSIDDGSSKLKGGRILVSKDKGDTWTDITDAIFENGIKGKDFYPNYCGDGYRLGGAESYLMGDATIYRSVDDVNLEKVVRGIAGCRSIVDFGDDSLLICGTQSPILAAQNNIMVSTDQGRTWQNVMTFYQNAGEGAGGGYKYSLPAVQFAGDTEPCVLMPCDYGNVPSYRVYRGGDHYYREAMIMLENTTDTPITITAKTGYMMPYPTKSLRKSFDDGLVYELPLNEGCGIYVHDSTGNVAQIKGANFAWEKNEEPVRYGDYSGDNVPTPFMPSSGLFIGKNTELNMGSIATLNFSKNYTISFWLNAKSPWLDSEIYSNRPPFYSWLRINEIMFYRAQSNGRMGYTNTNLDNLNQVSSLPRSALQDKNPTYLYSDQYFHIVITVDDNRQINHYINGNANTGIRDDNALDTTTWANLSEGDLILTCGTKEPLGYLSDLRIYNKALTLEEIKSLYRGF